MTPRQRQHIQHLLDAAAELRNRLADWMEANPANERDRDKAALKAADKAIARVMEDLS